MLEYALVEVPSVYPNCCLLCGAGKGPMLDTHVEKWEEHFYLCQLCATRIARVFGLVKGERMDQLLDAANELGEKDRQLASLENENQELRLANGNHRRRLGELKAQLADSAGQAQTMGHIASELERIARSLVEVAGNVPAESQEALA